MKLLGYVQREGHPVVANLAAQLGALVCLAAASVVIARTGGAAAVGNYSLLRLLPWLAGRLLSCGMPSCITYFLAGPSRDDPRLRPNWHAFLVRVPRLFREEGFTWAGIEWFDQVLHSERFHSALLRQIECDE